MHLVQYTRPRVVNKLAKKIPKPLATASGTIPCTTTSRPPSEATKLIWHNASQQRLIITYAATFLKVQCYFRCETYVMWRLHTTTCEFISGSQFLKYENAMILYQRFQIKILKLKYVLIYQYYIQINLVYNNSMSIFVRSN